MRAITILLLFLWANAAPAASPAPVGAPLEVVTADGGHHAFTVEVASTSEQLATGLMYRTSLAPDHGMLFDFGQPRPIAMWMKNTFIPLDMLFITADGHVISVAERTVPQSTTTITAPRPARAVLEVNGGTAERLGIKAGDKVVHPLFGN